MRYLWTEDTGAGLHFWKLINQFLFDDTLVVESKQSNQGLLDAVLDLNIEADDEYYIAFDYVVDNQDIRNKYRVLKSLVNELTQNEKWSVKGSLMGECWYKDCCVSEYKYSLRCGVPTVKIGEDKIRMLIQSDEVQRVIGDKPERDRVDGMQNAEDDQRHQKEPKFQPKDASKSSIF